MKRLFYKLLFYKKHTNILEPRKLKKILILRYDRLGDMIVTLPLIQTIKKAYPHYQIDLLASDMNKEIISKHPTVNNIFIYNFRGKKNIFKFFNTFNKLRQEKYDLVIDPFFNNHSRSAIHLRFINAKFNIGLAKRDKYGLDCKEFKLLYETTPFDESQHLVPNLLSIATILDIPKENFEENVQFHLENELKIAKSFLEDYHHKKIVVFNIQGSSQKRSFNDEFVINLSSKLTEEKEIQVILICMPNRREALEKELNKSNNKKIVIANTKTILDAIALVELSDLVISPDTSIVHAAATLQKEIVTFYNHDKLNFTLFSPYNTKYTVFKYEDLFVLDTKTVKLIANTLKKKNIL